MLNTSIPATAEGMSEIHVEKRIAELGKEISHLLDRKAQPATLMVFPASTRFEPRFETDICVGQSALSSALIKGADNIDAARSIVDLMNYALESMSGDENLRTEANALQFGMNSLGKHLNSAKAEFEKARSLAQ
ncbi:hypothetical protein AGRO_0749 [Agrobacterium sp. ATCC 31749]|uniref:hypothetical protein n=1 Tax=unclassified Agrobacterium TaxID=2632611 RepID=UPI00020DBB1D|nr:MULTISPECIES: hypothetical protein [unclassified Agrobacterium]EGL66504.1 hypothetical protein AGRO_0749 [Agrobacterium sp. ATCC 31749]QKW97310.1 hypothetical protein GSF67_09535 [Agrobacterium sp. CGMCC 11546]